MFVPLEMSLKRSSLILLLLLGNLQRSKTEKGCNFMRLEADFRRFFNIWDGS